MPTEEPSMKMTLIVSDEANPQVELKPNQRLAIVSVKLADEALNESNAIAARLCSGGGTCIALIEVD